MKRFEIRLDKDLHEKLRKESFFTGKSMHEIVIELIKEHYRGKERLGMLKLILKEEGQTEILAEGTIVELIKYLETNYDNLFSWIESDHNSQLPDELEKVELPSFSKVETLRDLESELEKVDINWWKLAVKEV